MTCTPPTKLPGAASDTDSTASTSRVSTPTIGALRHLIDVASRNEAPDFVFDALIDVEGWLRNYYVE